MSKLQPRRATGPGMRRGARLGCARATCSLALPPVMVNSCTGKMGHEAATSLVNHGFQLIPHTFTGLSSGVAVGRIGVRGVPVQLVGKERRQAALDSIKEAYPNMIVVDYTLAHCVEDHVRFYADNGLPFVMGTGGGDRRRLVEVVEAAGAYAVLPSPAGDQAASLHALLVSLGAPLPARFEEFSYEALGRGADGAALDLLNPGAAAEIARALRAMGISCDEAQVHRMRAARQQRVSGMHLHLEREPPAAASLHALQGRGTARTCRLTPPPPLADPAGPAPGAQAPSAPLLLRHYGLDRTAFAVGAVEAARFLAERVAEGSRQRVFDMVDVLVAVRARQAAQQGAPGRPGAGAGGGGSAGAGVQNNVVAVAAGAALTASVPA